MDPTQRSELEARTARDGSSHIGPKAPARLARERESRRHEEDRAYVPVIVKRTDIAKGLEQLCRPVLSLWLSSITKSVEMFTASLMSDEFSLVQTGRFIGTALFGNLIGGSLFVAVLNYAHIRETL